MRHIRPQLAGGLAAVGLLCLVTGCDDDQTTTYVPLPVPVAATPISNPPASLPTTPDARTLLVQAASVTLGGAEIAAYAPSSQQAFVVGNGNNLLSVNVGSVLSASVSVASLGGPQAMALPPGGSTTSFALDTLGASVQSVAVRASDGLVAVAVGRSLDGTTIYRSGWGSDLERVPNGSGGFVANEYYLLTDRGPNGATTERNASGSSVDVKVFPEPTFSPRIGRVRVNTGTGRLELISTILLRDAAGVPLTGLPNPGATGTGEVPRDLEGRTLALDPTGIDSEGLVALQDGTFYVSDEYGPHIAYLSATGATLARINPASGSGAWAGKTLPGVYGRRRANRGMEGLAYVPASEDPFTGGANAWVVGVMQSTMENPSRRFNASTATSVDVRNSPLTRILFFPANPASTATPREFVYLQEAAGRSNSGIRYVPGSGGLRFLVLERDGEFGVGSRAAGQPGIVVASPKDALWSIDLTGATDVHLAGDTSARGRTYSFDVDGDTVAETLTLEQLTAGSSAVSTATALARLATVGVVAPPKTLFLDINSTPYEHDKVEGFVLLDLATRQVVLANDDDFGFTTVNDTVYGTGEFGRLGPKQLTLGGSTVVDHPFLYTLTADGTGLAAITQTAEMPLSSLEVMVPADATRHLPGVVAFFNGAVNPPTFRGAVAVGALPDMLTFTPDGSRLLVANEGEPNNAYTYDPEGSISVIQVGNNPSVINSASVAHLRFTDFNVGGSRAAQLPAGVRIYGPGTNGSASASVAQDLEPEYIAVAPDGSRAWVTLQENNALAVVDLGATPSISGIVALGTKDARVSGNGFDASDRDAAIAIRSWPVSLMYQPDAIAATAIGGSTYLFTANEGDARAYAGFDEERRVKDLTLDATAFTGWGDLRNDAQLGRLKVTRTLGNTDSDPEYEGLFGYGARSFTVWSATGSLIWDSGQQFETITAARLGSAFNDNDGRSDDKGPEPEAIATGVIDGRTYCFIGLERTNGVFVYDVTTPTAPTFVQYLRSAGDVSPEGMIFVPAANSPNGKALLLVSHEVSGTMAIYTVGGAVSSSN